jgi:uncharacterized protein
MNPRRLLLVVAGMEAALAAVAMAWIALRRIPIALGDPVTGIAGGAALALALAAAYYVTLRTAPDVEPVRSLRKVYAELLRPAFARIGPAEVLGISVAAGVGEELLFRGAVQPELGLIGASLLFGAMHVGGTGTIVFGAWAALTGFILGWSAEISGGLLLPMIAHSTYDALALAYVRWGPPLPGEPKQREDLAT